MLRELSCGSKSTYLCSFQALSHTHLGLFQEISAVYPIKKCEFSYSFWPRLKEMETEWKHCLTRFGEWKNFYCLCSVKGCDNVFPQLSVRQTKQVFTFIMDYLRRHSSSGNLESIITLHYICLCFCTVSVYKLLFGMKFTFERFNLFIPRSLLYWLCKWWQTLA